MAIVKEGTEDSANAKALERLHERANKKREEELPPGEVEVNLTGPDEEESDDDPEDERPLRAERRRERGQSRYAEQLEARRQAEQERDQFRQQAEQMRAEREQWARQQTPQELPEDVHIRGADLQLRNLELEWDRLPAAEQTQAKAEEFRKKAQDLGNAKTSLIVAKTARMMGAGQPQQNPQAVALYSQLQTQYPDVLANNNAKAYAKGEYARLLALGNPDDWTTVTKAMEATRQQFSGGARKAPAATETRRAQLSGASKGGGSTDGATRNTVKVSSDERKMARSLYPNLSEAEAVRKWAQGPGRRLAEKRA